MTAARALIANGWEVSEPIVAEAYDLVARDPLTKEWWTIQVKTLRIREDRGNALVINAKKGNGEAYTLEDCDYIVGVDNSRVFLLENREIREYWSTEMTAKERWIELTAEENDAVSAS